MKMLRARRKECNLTMKQLGEMVGVSESAISQYETGKRQADFETLLKLGDALDCSVDYLLRGSISSEKEEKLIPVAGDELDELDIELLKKLRTMSPERKKALLDLLDPKD